MSTPKYRALNLKQPSNLRGALKDAMKNGTALIGTGLGFASLDVARMVATTGADWVFLDAGA